MSSYDMAATMDGIATLLAGLAPNIYPYPADAVTVPCIVVGYPETVDFDAVFERGGDRAVHPVWFVVGTGPATGPRDALSLILADASSVKSALDGNQSFGSVRVTDAEIERVTIGDIAYPSAKFTVEVYT